MRGRKRVFLLYPFLTGEIRAYNKGKQYARGCMEFVKMQATGNDYVYAEERETEGRDLPELAREISDRRTGVGGDGLIVLSRAGEGEREYDLSMRVFNADGSEGEICGNGVRCAAKLAYERLGVRVNPMRVRTKAGVRAVRMIESEGKVFCAEAEMGRPRPLPLGAERERRLQEVGLSVDFFRIFPVDAGNPHLVVFDEEDRSLLMLGRLCESSGAFPDGVNVEQVRRIPGGFSVRVLERGSGETFSCGSGAVAVAFAALRSGRVGEEEGRRGICVGMRGGRLQVRFEGETAFLRGKIEEVFTGRYEI